MKLRKTGFGLRSKIQENLKFVQNGFGSKIENTRTNKILKSIILPQDFNVKNIVQYLIYPIDVW